MSRGFDDSPPVFEDVMRLTAQSRNMTHICLSNTQSNVSVNIYFETKYDDTLMVRGPVHYRYIAVGKTPPDFEKEYNDFTYGKWISDRRNYEKQLASLSSGWKEIGVFEGEYSRTT